MPASCGSVWQASIKHASRRRFRGLILPHGCRREPWKRKHVVGGNYPLWKVWINPLRRSSEKHRFYWCRPAPLDLQYDTVSVPMQAPWLFISLSFSKLSGTLRQEKKHNGWHRMVSAVPEDITNARPFQQLQASLKDMTDWLTVPVWLH